MKKRLMSAGLVVCLLLIGSFFVLGSKFSADSTQAGQDYFVYTGTPSTAPKSDYNANLLFQSILKTPVENPVAPIVASFPQPKSQNIASQHISFNPINARLALDSQGNIYYGGSVSYEDPGYVRKFDPQGKFITSMVNPGFIGLDKNDNLYFSVYNDAYYAPMGGEQRSKSTRDGIYHYLTTRYDKDFKIDKTFSKDLAIWNPGINTNPFTVTVNTESLYNVNSSGSCSRQNALRPGTAGTYAVSNNAYTCFGDSLGNGYALVGDKSTHMYKIEKYNTDGTLITSWPFQDGQGNNLEPSYKQPLYGYEMGVSRIAVGPDNNIYVLGQDGSTSRMTTLIIQYSSDGKFVSRTALETPKTAADIDYLSRDFKVDKSGNLYFATKSSIYKYDGASHKLVMEINSQNIKDAAASNYKESDYYSSLLSQGRQKNFALPDLADENSQSVVTYAYGKDGSKYSIDGLSILKTDKNGQNTSKFINVDPKDGTKIISYSMGSDGTSLTSYAVLASPPDSAGQCSPLLAKYNFEGKLEKTWKVESQFKLSNWRENMWISKDRASGLSIDTKGNVIFWQDGLFDVSGWYWGIWKYDANGNQLAKAEGGRKGQYMRDLLTDKDGNIYLVNNIFPLYDYRLPGKNIINKFSSSLNLLKSFSLPGVGVIDKIALVSGSTSSTGTVTPTTPATPTTPTTPVTPTIPATPTPTTTISDVSVSAVPSGDAYSLQLAVSTTSTIDSVTVAAASASSKVVTLDKAANNAFTTTIYSSTDAATANHLVIKPFDSLHIVVKNSKEQKTFVKNISVPEIYYSGKKEVEAAPLLSNLDAGISGSDLAATFDLSQSRATVSVTAINSSYNNKTVSLTKVSDGKYKVGMKKDNSRVSSLLIRLSNILPIKPNKVNSITITVTAKYNGKTDTRTMIKSISVK